jgi:hypothetical protein
MRIGIVRRDALDVDGGARLDDVVEMLAQAIPIGLTVLVIDVALVADFWADGNSKLTGAFSFRFKRLSDRLLVLQRDCALPGAASQYRMSSCSGAKSSTEMADYLTAPPVMPLMKRSKKRL